MFLVGLTKKHVSDEPDVIDVDLYSYGSLAFTSVAAIAFSITTVKTIIFYSVANKAFQTPKVKNLN